MSKAFTKIIKTLIYNRSLEVIETLNKSCDDKKEQKFVGTDSKSKKDWDTVAARASDAKSRENAQPITIRAKGGLDYIMNRITSGKLPVTSTERNTMIQKYANRDWGYTDNLKKAAKDYGTTGEAIDNYTKYIAFIAGSMAYEGGKKFTLKKDMLLIIDKLIEC